MILMVESDEIVDSDEILLLRLEKKKPHFGRRWLRMGMGSVIVCLIFISCVINLLPIPIILN